MPSFGGRAPSDLSDRGRPPTFAGAKSLMSVGMHVGVLIVPEAELVATKLIEPKRIRTGALRTTVLYT